MDFNKKDKIDVFENAISWIVVFAMFVYGGAKTFQFEGAIDIQKNVSEMTGMELMWAFYGYSKPYALFLGLTEIIGGILILVKKTRIIGCLIVTTVLVNVIVQDIYFEVHIGALKACILYQFIVLTILWLNRFRLIQSIKILVKQNKTEQSKIKFFVKLSAAFILFVLLRITEYYITRS
jgi:uncharacterized membrane protein